MKTLLSLAFWILSVSNIFSQDTVFVRGTKTVSRNETLTYSPGTIIALEPGAIIWAEGSLQLKGSKEKPIQIISVDPRNPGQGIVVSGDNSQATIFIQNVNFIKLSLPLSFEPFWNRKEVDLNQVKINGSSGNEPIIFVPTPLVTQNAKAISFKLINSTFINNTNGLLIEHVGGNGIIYELDNLVFSEKASGTQESNLGNLHLDLATPFNASNIKLGNLAFSEPLNSQTNPSISLGGNSGFLEAKGIYTRNGERAVSDSEKDPRLATLRAPISDINTWPGEPICYIGAFKHKTNSITATKYGSCKISNLLDTNGNNIPFTQVIKGDSVFIEYTQSVARTLVLDNGVETSIPKPELAIVDNASLLADKPIEDDSIKIKVEKPWKPNFEVGVWGGLAFYVGDVKHRFGIPGVYEWSKGIYAQYNKTEDWSFRLGFNRTDIGMHDPTAAVLLWRSADTYGIRPDGTTFVIPSWDMNFKTKMYILEFDAVYYLSRKHNNYTALKYQDQGHWIPAIGFGAGLMHYEPYRCVVYNRDKDTAEYIKLRQMGTEGQNFLSGKRDYNSIALNLNISFQLAYAYKNWRFKYEFKTCLSFSDYLDDMGQGYLYGGDYDEWLKSVEGIEMPINKVTGNQIEVQKAFKNYTSTQKRTTNLLPDMFFPQHIGVSYCFGSNQKKKDKK